ncbi:hypothetical protein AB9F26_22155, partial [Falsihalocynthiibacter sp. BN13B15]|uniref:hypothetical protein n=1 Tax=Falsihalocynthiibacter sp. BN13B15 TaxID=3240871 RepID=UPI00350FF9D5
RTPDPRLFKCRLLPLTRSHLAQAANSHFPPFVSIDMNGPKQPFTVIPDAALQLPKSSRSSRTQHWKSLEV